MKKERSTVYVLRAGAFVKVGYTRAAVEKRVSEYESGIPVPWSVAYRVSLPASAGLVVESLVHEWMKQKRSYGEWFRVTPAFATERVKDAVQIVRRQQREARAT